MAQFYTLEEASKVLGMSPEELKAQAQQRKVRAFLDGGTWRFRVGDVDELARRRGMGSDAELRLSDLDIPVAPPEEPDEIDLSEFHLGVADPDLGSPTLELLPNDAPVSDSGSGSGSEQDVLLDDMSLPPNTMASSSVIIGMQTTGGRMPSDSDVRLIPDNAGSDSRASDSDVRLAPQEFIASSDSGLLMAKPAKGKVPGDSDVTLRQPGDSDVTLFAGETGEHEALLPGLGDTAIRQSPIPSGSSVEMAPMLESGSDFDLDLTPSGAEGVVLPDSGSDFELSVLEGSDEFEATPLSGPSDSDVTAVDPGFSGINLSRPSDSGINLQMASGLGLGTSDSIELTPLSGSNIKPVPPAKPKPSLAKTPPPTRKAATPPPEKDIFDDTDFEVDALGSDRDADDRTVQLEAHSDFELEDADTGSEVFAIDEEDVDQNAATALGPGVAGSGPARRPSTMRTKTPSAPTRTAAVGTRSTTAPWRLRPRAARRLPRPSSPARVPRPSGGGSGSGSSASRPCSCSS